MKTYKTVRGALTYIISNALVINDNMENIEDTIVTLYHNEAVNRILGNFNVTPKQNNEFGLDAVIDNIAT